MTSTKKMVSSFMRRNSKSSTNQDLDVVDIVAYLNDAMEMVFDNLVELSEVDKKYSNILRKLEVKKYKPTFSIEEGDHTFLTYPDNLYKRGSISIKASKEGCKGFKIIPVYNGVSSDEGELIRNPYRQADFAYEQIFGDEAGEGYYIYQKDEMKIEEIYMSYIKRPRELHAPSLVKCDGDEFYYDYLGKKITKDTDLEFGNTFISNTIITVAILLATTSARDTLGIQGEINTLLQVSKIS